jgi:outer membrane lipoprotein-sorting protein
MVPICTHLVEGLTAHAASPSHALNLNLNLSLIRMEIKIKSKIEIKSMSMIMRRIRSIACLLAVLALGSASGRAAELDGRFERWFAAQTNLQSWAGDFTQTRTLQVLSQPLVSTGKVWVTATQFRWELGQPAQTIALRQPDKLLIIYPKLKRAEKYSLTDVPVGPIKDALALLDASLPRDRASMEDRFKLVSAVETNSVLEMTLQPKSASARKFIGEIRIAFRTNDFSIASTEMKFAEGTKLRNDFTNVVLNGPIDPTLFEGKLGPDYKTVEPLAGR